MAADFSQAAIYVGTYAKYNAGSLFGKWFDLSDFADKDEFLEACKELHKDEDDPEFMFQDRENIPEELVSESWISDLFFEYDEEEDYARELIEQCYELSDFVLNYFDYAAFARDLFNDGYKFLDGFVFCA